MHIKLVQCLFKWLFFQALPCLESLHEFSPYKIKIGVGVFFCPVKFGLKYFFSLLNFISLNFMFHKILFTLTKSGSR
jgi:hypothetical protein